MHILISGASGFIGRALVEAALERGDHVSLWLHQSARSKRYLSGIEQHNKLRAFYHLEDVEDEPVDAVINLAGAGIADQRWSKARKQVLYDSRIDTTATLVNWLARQSSANGTAPDLLNASAIGYYGYQQDDDSRVEGQILTPSDHDFGQRLCMAWEQRALEAERSGSRVCLLRTAVVLGAGGALAKMLPAFRFGLGGPIGHGRQWFSWIHLADEIAAILFLLDNKICRGAYNLSAPGALSNAGFARALGKRLERPAILPLPSLVPKLMLGEGAPLLLEGQRIYPQRLLEAGFEFRYPSIEQALEAITF